MIPNNVRTVRITAAAGTNLARASSEALSNTGDNPRTLHPLRQRFTIRRPSSRTRRRSVRLAPIAEDSRLQPPVGVWAVLSPSGGGHALTPPSHRRLGEPLPHQLASSASAAPQAESHLCWFAPEHRVLPTVSRGYPRPEGTYRRDPTPFAGFPLAGSPSTCMPNPRRQRSF